MHENIILSILEQVNMSTYLGCKISYEERKDTSWKIYKVWKFGTF